MNAQALKKLKQRNAKYWKDRAERNLLLNEKTALQYEKDLRSAYNSAINRVQVELDYFYARYAKENGITLQQAMQNLSNTERKSFREQQERYLKEAELHAADPAYIKQLKTLSAKTYVTKLDELTQRIRHEVEMLAANQVSGVTDVMNDSYKSSYYRTAFDMSVASGVLVDFNTIGDTQLHAAVSEKWNGDNYDNRIWTNKTKLVNALNTMIPVEFVRGRSNAQIADDLATQLNVSYRNAVRLVRTETNYISNKATMRMYEDSGVVEKFQYLATLDMRTSEICRDLDGKIFELKDARVGVNVPPLHPHCRSTTIPWFEDNITDDRIARDKDDNNVFIGADITFTDWYNKYVKKAA